MQQITRALCRMPQTSRPRTRPKPLGAKTMNKQTSQNKVILKFALFTAVTFSSPFVCSYLYFEKMFSVMYIPLALLIIQFFWSLRIWPRNRIMAATGLFVSLIVLLYMVKLPDYYAYKKRIKSPNTSLEPSC
jgi:hypothetical protein